MTSRVMYKPSLLASGPAHSTYPTASRSRTPISPILWGESPWFDFHIVNSLITLTKSLATVLMSFSVSLMDWVFSTVSLYLLSIPLSLHLGYIAAFGVAFYILEICGVLFIMELPHCGWGCISGLSRFLG